MLVVDDDPIMAGMLRAALDAEGFTDVAVAGSGAAALDSSHAPDVVLLDHQLPDTTGIDLLPRLLARPDPPSVIMVTGEGGAELAANALRLGAEDYLVKGPKLLAALPGIVERARRNRLLRSTRTEVERELVRAERLAAIGEMTVTLHHELNNPLMAAMAEVELLLQGSPTMEEMREALTLVRTALFRMRDIVKQARDLQRADSADYLSGLPMIDLSARAAPVAVARGRAVLVAANRELSRAVALLLRHAGWTVDKARTISEAQHEAARLDTTLVVISVPGTFVDPLQGFHAPPDRPYTLVALVPGSPAPARAAGADLVLSLPFDPASFTSEVLAAMRRRGE